LAALALALRGTLNDTRRVQQLNARALVHQIARNGRQGGELHGRDRTFRIRQLGQHRGLTHRWKTAQTPHTTITHLKHRRHVSQHHNTGPYTHDNAGRPKTLTNHLHTLASYPIIHTRASPDFCTSKPSPLTPLPVGSNSCVRSLCPTFKTHAISQSESIPTSYHTSNTTKHGNANTYFAKRAFKRPK